ncbi:MAG: c-type cytochrome [Rhodospirillales bacterium]|jgi:cytochrome c553
MIILVTFAWPLNKAAGADKPLMFIPPVLEKCASCHGLNGISNGSNWPNLAGQKKIISSRNLNFFGKPPDGVMPIRLWSAITR